MSVAGAIKDYTFKQKRDWRGWQWNRIANRIACKPRDAVVLGMFGAEALDVEPALKRGFRIDNLIGVERNAVAARQARALGVNTIIGEFSRVVSCWGNAPKIDVVVADFCGGVTPGRVDDVLALAHSRAVQAETLICVNLLRGHDKFFLSLRRGEFFRVASQLLESRFVGLNTRSRSLAFPAVLVSFFLLSAASWKAVGSARDASSVSAEYAEVLNAQVERMRMEVFWYRSGNLVFDTIVFNMPFADMQIEKGQASELFTPRSVRAQVAAAKATRTMRLCRAGA